MPATRTSELARMIFGLCRLPGGKTTEELAEILERNRNSVCSYVSEIVKAGDLYRGGVVRNYRYFGSEQEAKEFTQKAESKLAKQKEEAAERRRKRDIEKARRQHQKEMQQKRDLGLTRQQKPRIDLAMRDSGLVIATKQQEIDHKRFHQQANVIWPENVKVTIIPTGQDTRFKTFVEPGKGQISRDWAQRRKFENQRNSHGK